MSLANEAAYLYVHALKLRKVQRKIERVMTKVKKYANQYRQSASAEDKHKYQQKHHKASARLKELFQKQYEITNILRHHHTAFAHQMMKEHNTMK